MNRKLIIRVLGAILAIEAMAMIPAFLISLYYQDGDTAALGWTVILTLSTGGIMYLIPTTDQLSAIKRRIHHCCYRLGDDERFWCPPFHYIWNVYPL